MANKSSWRTDNGGQLVKCFSMSPSGRYGSNNRRDLHPPSSIDPTANGTTCTNINVNYSNNRNTDQMVRLEQAYLFQNGHILFRARLRLILENHTLPIPLTPVNCGVEGKLEESWDMWIPKECPPESSSNSAVVQYLLYRQSVAAFGSRSQGLGGAAMPCMRLSKEVGIKRRMYHRLKRTWGQNLELKNRKHFGSCSSRQFLEP